MNASQDQHGGDHYKRMSISPWDVIDTWPLAERIGFYRGNLLKYTMRMHDKDAPADNVGKAEHYAAKLREVLGETSDQMDGPFRHCKATGQICDRTPTCPVDHCTRPTGIPIGPGLCPLTNKPCDREVDCDHHKFCIRPLPL